METNHTEETLPGAFREVPDPRAPYNQKHRFLDHHKTGRRGCHRRKDHTPEQRRDQPDETGPYRKCLGKFAVHGTWSGEGG